MAFRSDYKRRDRIVNEWYCNHEIKLKQGVIVYPSFIKVYQVVCHYHSCQNSWILGNEREEHVCLSGIFLTHRTEMRTELNTLKTICSETTENRSFSNSVNWYTFTPTVNLF